MLESAKNNLWLCRIHFNLNIRIQGFPQVVKQMIVQRGIRRVGRRGLMRWKEEKESFPTHQTSPLKSLYKIFPRQFNKLNFETIVQRDLRRVERRGLMRWKEEKENFPTHQTSSTNSLQISLYDRFEIQFLELPIGRSL